MKVISGGQTGVDLAALRAALACGMSTGGWAPRGFLTEAGPRPWLADRFDMREHSSSRYPPRTEQNVQDSDATLIIARELSGDPELNLRQICFYYKKRVFHINPLCDFDDRRSFSTLVEWLTRAGMIETLNVAGTRESKDPGIGKASQQFLEKVFAQL